MFRNRYGGAASGSGGHGGDSGRHVDREEEPRYRGMEVAGLPAPCSGGRGNRYLAVVKAVDANKKVLAKAKIKLGRY